MGTWGPGPFDSDNAADYATVVRAAADTTARRTVLLNPMRLLLDAKLDTEHLADRDEYEVEGLITRAMAAVAFVADSNLGRSHHTDNAFARGVTDDGPISILPPVDLPDVDDELRTTATQAVDLVLSLLDPDVPQDDYRLILIELRGHLAAPATQESTA